MKERLDLYVMIFSIVFIFAGNSYIFTREQASRETLLNHAIKWFMVYCVLLFILEIIIGIWG